MGRSQGKGRGQGKGAESRKWGGVKENQRSKGKQGGVKERVGCKENGEKARKMGRRLGPGTEGLVRPSEKYICC